MAFDGWTRITLPKAHIEAEAAILSATVAQPSLIPGVLLNNSPVQALQVGAALEHAVLFPLAGLDNEALRLKAQPAQLIRLRLTYSF
jgi:hypothetical protein